MFRLGFPALLLCTGVLFVALWIFETQPITGRVVDMNGNPVAQAEVQLEKLFGEKMFPKSWRWKRNRFEPVYSDQDGRFLVPFPKTAGEFRLVVSHWPRIAFHHRARVGTRQSLG